MNTKFAISCAAASALSLTAVPAWAFHDGGVATCDSCHTMHNSKNGQVMTRATATPSRYESHQFLLQGTDQSSTCLNCHGSGTTGSYHIYQTGVAATSAPANYTPGGDFGWLEKTFTWTGRSGLSQELGDSHGHNIIAVDFGRGVDSRLTSAPGGIYNSNNLSCISCHDPHGRYRILSDGSVGTTGESIGGSGSYGAMPGGGVAVGVYRLLGGVGYAPKSYQAVPFVSASPIAVAPSTYNRSEATTDTRVAYGTGMSEWCANCHTGIHNDTYSAILRHPAGSLAGLGATQAANYNAYVASGNMTGGQATSYSSLVPYEEHTTDRAALTTHAVNDGSQTAGPEANSTVMCLSCHRAHASGFESMLRWNMSFEYMTVDGSYPGTDATNVEAQNANFARGRTVAQNTAAYNGRPATNFAIYQRSLCNKCHAKD